MRVALFKMATLIENHDIKGHPFTCEEGGEQELSSWVRVSEWVEVDFPLIEVDIETAKREAAQRKIDELQKSIDKLKVAI